MSTPKTEHRGHVIWWSDNEEKWSCMDISYSHEKLSRVRAKIDAMYLAMRKASAVQCFRLEGLGSWGEPKLNPATVIEYRAPIFKEEYKNFRTTKTDVVIDHSVAATYVSSGSTRASKNGVKLSELVPDTDEAKAAFGLALAAQAEVEAAKARFKAAIAAIPRLTLADVQGLVDAAKGEEGEA